MDKLSKKILNYMIKSGKGTSFSCSLDPDWDAYSDVPLSTLVEKVKSNEADVRAAIAYLASSENEYLQYGRLKSSSGPVNIKFCLTHRGLHYKEIQWEEVRQFIMGSIFTPIVVSVLTTLLTAWLTEL